MLLAAALVLTSVAPPQDSTPPEALPLREVLAVERLGVRKRSAVYTDALEAELVRGAWRAPVEGDTLHSTTGDERTWTRVEAGEDGWFSGDAFQGGWAFAVVDVPASGAWRLDASGHSFVLVDGEPRAGDVYALGTTRVPLALAAGEVELLFRCGRGRLRATLEPAPAPVYLEEKDRTLPDVVRGEGGTLLLGTIVSNATPSILRGWTVVASPAGGVATTTALPDLLPASLRKCRVDVEVPAEVADEELAVALELRDDAGALVHSSSLALAVRDADERHARSFVSSIDGSVQYYAVSPAAESDPDTRPALILTLHGAGVEARSQAAAYAPKDWAVVVAPTNRRPFGFDWEDWGRLDAMEVLALAEERYGTDPRRTYLTGHSMGGHGTWQVGVHFPDRFAAIAPSAGWCDFWGYAGGGGFDEEDPVGPLLTRAVNASRTLILERNTLLGGIYVLHGDADDNVPVTEARAMRERLGAFHPNFAYYERPGAGHWWGDECVDWPPLMAFLRENRLPSPAEALELEFTTVNPALSDRFHWVRVVSQRRWMEPSRVTARLDPEERLIELELENVARLELDLARFRTAGEGEPLLPRGEPVRVRVGEEELELPETDGPVEIAYGRGGGPQTARPLAPWYKAAHRAGPFKDAFRHRMVFVYGTAGTPEENAWAFAKARYDHETWRYRGNGAVDVVADVDFVPQDFADRGVVLYGNHDTNAAWELLLGRAFDLRRGSVSIGDHVVEGDDLALLAVYPRKGSDVASVAVVGGTGLPGCRTTDHLPYFVSGVAYPDWTVIGAELLTEGLGGVRGAGFFRTDWSPLEGAEEAWRQRD